MTAYNHEDICKRAYEIWEREGCPHGRDNEHWQQALRELSESEAVASTDEKPATGNSVAAPNAENANTELAVPKAGRGAKAPSKPRRKRGASKAAAEADAVTSAVVRPLKTAARKVKAVASSSGSSPSKTASAVELEVSKPEQPSKSRRASASASGKKTSDDI